MIFKMVEDFDFRWGETDAAGHCKYRRVFEVVGEDMTGADAEEFVKRHLKAKAFPENDFAKLIKVESVEGNGKCWRVIATYSTRWQEGL